MRVRESAPREGVSHVLVLFALEKARRNLAKLESLCGGGCAETTSLAASIAAGPQERVLTAEAVMPDAQVTQDN